MNATAAVWREHLSREEIRDFLRVESWRGWWSVIVDWALIAATFALVAMFPNPLTIVGALFIIGTRQLGLAVLMHEAAHHTLLPNRAWNDWVGNWLCGYPVWSDVRPYRPYHLQHHSKTWTAADPDLGLATPFPITRASLRRKIWRDLTGQTGWKRAKATLARDLGRTRGRSQRTAGAGWRNLRGVVVTNMVLVGALIAVGHPALYLLWVGAWFTTNNLVTRIRSIAEHGMTRDPADPLQNTRTMLARWWERLLIAPNRVNYHLEHHLLMTVPHYKLPRLHRLLRDRELLTDANVMQGYGNLLRLASSRPDDVVPTHAYIAPARRGF
jgi:fatty acid desaturase